MSASRSGRRIRTSPDWWTSLPPFSTKQSTASPVDMTESHQRPETSSKPRALAGIRVLDVTQFMAGPFCSTILADLGADVIKIEPPSGDSTRQMVGAEGTESPSFNAVNRGKRSVVINLKTLDGQQLFKRLAHSSEILIENYRPGVMQGLGLD